LDPQLEDGGDEFSPLRILAAVIRHRRLTVACTLLGMTAAVAIALFRRPTFTTTFSFLPQAAQERPPSGLAGLAGQFGLSLGAGSTAQSSQFYADLLATREILLPVALDTVTPVSGGRPQPVPLFLGISGRTPLIISEKTVTALKRKVISTSVATRTTGVISVQIKTTSAIASQQIAEKLLALVNAFNLNSRRTQAGEERRFVEGRLNAARTELRAAEDDLERFLQSNRQFNSPELTFQRERLDREVRLREQIVSGLAQQFEEARIREVRDTPAITIIERPAAAALPDRRGRIAIALGGTAAAFLIGVLGAVLSDGLGRVRNSYDRASELRGEGRQARGIRV